MAQAPVSPGVPLTPIRWPQDILPLPLGFGMMHEVDAVNKRAVRQEFFCYTGNIDVAQGQERALNIPITNDGDFYCTWIWQLARNLTSGLIDTGYLSYIRVTDAMTGYELFTPNVPARFLSTGSNQQYQTFAEPYCFQRGGAAVVTINTPPTGPAQTYTFYMMLAGWKEYEHASD